MNLRTIEDSAIQKRYETMEQRLDKDHIFNIDTKTTNITVINDSSIRRESQWPDTNHKWYTKKEITDSTTNYSTSSNKYKTSDTSAMR